MFGKCQLPDAKKKNSKEGDLVLDPFCGSSTTGVAAILLNRKYVGIEIEDEYLELSKKRLEDSIKNINLYSKACS